MRRATAFFEAVLLLAGTIIGVGMFGIPFAFVRAGFAVGIVELGILFALVLTLHLLYGEIVLATPSFHRMPGYMRLYLGTVPTLLSWASAIFGVTGTLLAYLAAGTLFLGNISAFLAPDANRLFFAFALACLGALVTFFPLKKAMQVNGLFAVCEITMIIGFSFLLLPHVSLLNFSLAHPERLFLPYGVLLFALSGGSVIPDMITILGRKRKAVHRAITIGSLLPALVYLLFALAVVGVSGSETTGEAIAGLGQKLGPGVVFWGSVAGFLAVLTSFIALAEHFQGLLQLDLKMPRTLAWVLASAIPFLLYSAGFQDFVAIISMVGAVAFGIDAVLIIFAYNRMRRANAALPGAFFCTIEVIICAMVVAGVAYELYKIFG